MVEAIFGLVGVLLGGTLTWLQTVYSTRQQRVAELDKRRHDERVRWIEHKRDVFVGLQTTARAWSRCLTEACLESLNGRAGDISLVDSARELEDRFRAHRYDLDILSGRKVSEAAFEVGKRLEMLSEAIGLTTDRNTLYPSGPRISSRDDLETRVREIKRLRVAMVVAMREEINAPMLIAP
ncbi:hypothetical protein GIS00_14360 [Nakamurella sp. YIM 132087]|uniref:Uncharacterized protein n=1 Tax=Nakamurella alba TaxID=2665158 RepID=A0A7K1FPH6_9ACTN|nr:hypothetical protein [Nakamurella alba]MTD15123.1 hypothetical protein [Nakamurella alba]